MLYAAILVIILSSGFLIACKAKIDKDKLPENTNNMQVNGNNDIPGDSIKPLFSKKQIELKLKKLANTPPPSDLAVGAMCYSPRMNDTTNFEYICPVCGEKTIYSDIGNNWEWSVESLEQNLWASRREVAKIKGVNIKLDETQFCKHCGVNHDKMPELCLLVNIGGESDTTKSCGVSSDDIQILREFLDGNLKHTDSYDYEYPLVDDIATIEKLTGLKSGKGKDE